MPTRKAQLDEENNRTESAMDRIERNHAVELHRQKERSEREFREGRVVSWDDLKAKCGLA